MYAYLANGAQERNLRGPVLNAAAAVSANPRAGRRMRRANVCEHNTYEHTAHGSVNVIGSRLFGMTWRWRLLHTRRA